MFSVPTTLHIFSLFSATTLEPNIGTVCDWKQSWGGVKIEGGGNFSPLWLSLFLSYYLLFPKAKVLQKSQNLPPTPSNELLNQASSSQWTALS